jgi:uncharacterized membrane-anchored protein
MLNKVPEVTLAFWLIKVLGTTVGETGADYMSETLKLGLSTTAVVMSAVLLCALVVQFRARRYVPAIYWTAVVLISIVGTLITDNLTDNLGWSLVLCTSIFAFALVCAFAVWYRVERSLSIHTIVTTRREVFYWSTILCTFALGTAAGDLISERVNLGYWQSALLFLSAIGAVAVAHFVFHLNEVTAFWMAYILTRPFGASVGDFLTQGRHDGGLGLSTNGVSLVFLAIIVVVVARLSVVRRRSTVEPAFEMNETETPRAA